MRCRLVGIVLALLSTPMYAHETDIFPANAIFEGPSAPLATIALHEDRHRQGQTLAPLRPIMLTHFAAPAPSALPASMLGPVRLGPAGVNADGIATGHNVRATGAVGDTQYVQLVDDRLAIYAKAGAALQTGPVSSSALFGDAQPCGAGSAANVQFDQLAKRWILSHIARGHDGTYHHCLAVSAGADAAGSYRRYRVPVTARDGVALHADDARLAVWPDAYYFTMALFDPAGAYLGPRACAIDRGALLAGRDAAAICSDLGPAYGPVTPASIDGYATAVNGAANTLLALGTASTGEQLFAWRFSFSRAAIGEAQAIPVAPYLAACATALEGACIAQAMPGSVLAAVGDRLMPRVAYRNHDGIESLLVNHSVQLDGKAGVRWYELRDNGGTLELYQQGTHAPDHNSRWMGALDIDKAGNIALAYQVAGSDTPPGIRFTGRQRSDPHGRMQGEAHVVDGTGVQAGPAGRAQLHGSLSLDPIDGCTFWITQRYAALTGMAAWRTRIASFRFQNCR